MHKYAQIQAQRHNDAQKYVQMRVDANTSRYTHIRANTRKFMQIEEAIVGESSEGHWWEITGVT